jgi:BTB/POZ domain-containing protein KCTD9
VKIFTAYIREKSSTNEKPNEDKQISTDVQAILEALFKDEHPDTHIINLQDANLIEAQLGFYHLKWVHLERANLKRAQISWADLECANLNGTNLEKAHLSSSNLKYTDLRVANLEKAILSEADLQSARLVKANLKWANLEGANLKEATFKDADLTKTNLDGADLTGAYYLSPAQLSKARSLYNTKLDEELSIILKDEHPELFENPRNEAELKRRGEILANLGFVPSKD